MQGGRGRTYNWRREKDVQIDRVLLMKVEMSARHTLLPNKASKLRWVRLSIYFRGPWIFGSKKPLA